MPSGRRAGPTDMGVIRQRRADRKGKRAVTRDLLCMSHEHLGCDAELPATRGKRKRRRRRQTPNTVAVTAAAARCRTGRPEVKRGASGVERESA